MKSQICSHSRGQFPVHGGVYCAVKSSRLTFGAVAGEILKFDHSNESYRAVSFADAVYCAI